MQRYHYLVEKRVEPSQADVIDPNSGELSNLDHYKPFFRELDVEVSKLISLEKVYMCQFFKLKQKNLLEFFSSNYFEQVTLAPDSSFESVGNVKLRPPELLFLLKDLESKIRRSLVGSKTKKGFPGRFRSYSNANTLSFRGLEILVLFRKDKRFEKCRIHISGCHGS